jgi:hypothetical protein
MRRLSVLNTWEQGFVRSLDDYRAEFSSKQIETLNRIFAQVKR